MFPEAGVGQVRSALNSMLISSAFGEWVSAPMEMISTPLRAA